MDTRTEPREGEIHQVERPGPGSVFLLLGSETTRSLPEPPGPNGESTRSYFESDGHSRRVTGYVAALALGIGVPKRQLPRLLGGAMLHDLGKIAVPDSILRKPGPLTPEERAAVKVHAELGYRLLRWMGFSSEGLRAVRHHHEWYNGKGYPYGLSGEQIPLDARIVAIADAFDAMTSDRPYRHAHSVEEAREEILRCAGTQFDPVVAEAFLKLGTRALEGRG